MLYGGRAGDENGDGRREKEIKFPPAQRQFKIKRALRRGLSVFSRYWIFLSLPFRAISSCVFFFFYIHFVLYMYNPDDFSIPATTIRYLARVRMCVCVCGVCADIDLQTNAGRILIFFL